MAKANKTATETNYVSRTASREELIKFLTTDGRQEFSALQILGIDFVTSQEDEKLIAFVDAANAWQPDFFDCDKSIIKSFVIEDPQERKSLGDAELAELESNCCVIKENTKFSYHKVSFSFYCPKDGDNISDHAEQILNAMVQEFVNLTTYCPSTSYKTKKDGQAVVVVPETASLPEKNLTDETASENN